MATRLSTVRARYSGTNAPSKQEVVPVTPHSPQSEIGVMANRAGYAGATSPPPRTRSAKVHSFRESKATNIMAARVSHYDLKARLGALAAFCRGDLEHSVALGGEKKPHQLTLTHGAALKCDTSPNVANNDECADGPDDKTGNAERRRLDSFLVSLYGLMDDLEMDIVPHGDYRKQYDPQGPLRLFFQRALRDPSRAVALNMAEHGFLPQTALLALSPDAAFTFNCNYKTVSPCGCTEPSGKRGARGTTQHTYCNFPFDSTNPSQRIFHYPNSLIEGKNEVAVHFRTLMKKIPQVLEEFLGFEWPIPASQFSKFKTSITSYLELFDAYYSRFERLYLDLINRVLLRAYEPLVGIYSVCTRVGGITDMAQLDLAMFCQNLGVLSREIDFGGTGRTEYDPKVIAKAMRVLHISTYAPIQRQAQRLLDCLIQVHAFFRDLNFKNGVSNELVPDLASNNSLVQLLLGTQSEWEISAIILQQATLDFFTFLLDGWLMQKLNVRFREKLRFGVTQQPKDDFFNQEAHQALYVDFPILLLLDNLYSSTSNKTASNFNDIFLGPKSAEAEERLLRAKGEIGKFDERRYQTLFNYTLGVATPQDQLSYFENLYSQLKIAANIDNTGQWLVLNVILQEVCDLVDPTIFPRKASAEISGGRKRFSKGKKAMLRSLASQKFSKHVAAFNTSPSKQNIE
eukprot:GEMP01015432.1.p1 GENE.GEMP01015432.1~~GEMP01015432.1.p1  ORF type:complete len:686 (+),score=125.02 GEMP01015432.1:203-2260(+)